MKATIKSKNYVITVEGAPEEIQKVIKKVKSDLHESAGKKGRVSSKGKASIVDRLIELREADFFNNPKTTSEVKEKFAESGFHYPAASLTNPLQRAVRSGALGRVKTKDGIWGYVRR
ncbi:Uncharacterised protein [uncultured archaeon]|nr:Uncharacterised protein [uncultured archaeon]